MDKRKDDRDAEKSSDMDLAVDPMDAQKTGDSQQASELQVGAEGERENLSRFEPDPKAELLYPETDVADAPQSESEDSAKRS